MPYLEAETGGAIDAGVLAVKGTKCFHTLLVTFQQEEVPVGWCYLQKMH